MTNDREILRGLAQQVRAIADLPEMSERRARWRRHNALRSERPLVLCFPEGAWGELITPGLYIALEAHQLHLLEVSTK